MTYFEPIAVVGQGCLLPGASNPEQLWDIVAEGRTVLSEPPENHWRIPMDQALSETQGRYEKNKSWVSRGGYIHGFSAEKQLKGLLQKMPSLRMLDSLVQWSAYAALQALEGISCPDDPKKTGLIMGNLSYPSASMAKVASEVWLEQMGVSQGETTDFRNRFMSGGSAAYVAQALGIEGRSFALDAACASGLYAIRLACEQLQERRLDMALAGAVNCTDPLFIHVGFCALSAMSKTGQSRPFHRDADGLIPAEGAAFVALKRLDDAIADGDSILGVIRGLGLANDGRRGGLLSPSSDGQVQAMKQAYLQSGLSPDLVSYVECHATGTLRGDSAEVKSMAAVFDKALPISSLKANLGHSITASGVAGLIKALASMKHQTIPTTPHAYPLADHITASQFSVPEENQTWSSDKPRVAAVNAFGFGGNNAHLLLEEWRDAAQFVPPSLELAPAAEVCVTGIEIKTHNAKDAVAFYQGLRNASLSDEPTEFEAHIDIRKTGFPPHDLKASLGQQLIMVELAQRLAQETGLPNEGLGILIGMGADPEICRYGLRARLEAALREALGDDEITLDTVAPQLEASHVLGTMPNVVANRISSALDARGMSFAVSQEDGSGLAALELALGAIGRGELSTALVGAVDLCLEPVNQAANATVLNKPEGADAAVALILKSREQAEQDGDQILGTIAVSSSQGNQSSCSLALDSLGYSHVSSLLLDLAVQLQEVQQGHMENSEGMIIPALDGAKDRVLAYASLWDQKYGFEFHRHSNAVVPQKTDLKVWRFGASTAEQLIDDLEGGRTSDRTGHRLVLWGRSEELATLKKRASILIKTPRDKGISLKGIYYSPKAVPGKVASLYTGAASSYPMMGRKLLLDCPQLLQDFEQVLPQAERYLSWVYQGESEESRLPYNQLVGSSFLCQIHGLASRKYLKIEVDGIAGLSSGETNSMFAHGIWNDMAGLLDDVAASGLYQTHMAGSFDAVRKAWGLGPDDAVPWENYRVLAPVSKVKSLLEGTERVYISIINSPNDLVICGHREELQRVLKQLPKGRYNDLGHDLAVHCNAVKDFEGDWRRIHTRPTQAPTGGLKVYSNYLDGVYQPSSETVADALTGQAFQTIDFPKIIEAMWDDGFRIFVEHGPRQSLSESIRSILGDKVYTAVAYDSPDSQGLEGMIKVAAALWTSGHDVSWDWLKDMQAPELDQATYPKMSFPLRLADPEPFTPKQQGCLMERTPDPAESRRLAKAPTLSLGKKPLRLEHNDDDRVISTKAHIVESRKTKALSAVKPRSTRPGPKFSRDDLKILAGGKISDRFGPEFVGQDAYPIQVRMPEPPLLLCDRVLGIDGDAKSMGKGIIWTETDVFDDSWYLVNGRMPAGIFIESGQADLLLISWLGIDFHCQGERAYRLLGCELEFHGELPKPGETLSYQIHVDGHAKHGDVRLFFFHYDCYINGELRISVRSGQAGFFSKNELAASDGVLWKPETGAYTDQPRLEYPDTVSKKTALSQADILSFREGQIDRCFGNEFAYAATHTRTPKISDGPLQFIDQVQELDFSGGPKGRGYVLAKTAIDPDHWYFDGHFKNDPCMPGTLMAEGCLEAMAIYMAATGVTLRRDGWRFEPATETKYLFKCRGQVTPDSKELSYELFIDEFYWDGQVPTLFAHVLCTVDGRKAFLCERLGLRLVPDYPLTTIRDFDDKGVGDGRPVAMVGDFKFDYQSLINCAWGHPQKAFGPDFPFEVGLRTARLPSPPYHFMTRILEVNGDYLGQRAGAKVKAAYDFHDRPWYFDDNPHGVMPYAVLMEIALQPCGWLATYSGLPGVKGRELLFRNLDGKAKALRPIKPEDSSLVTTSELTAVSKMSNIIIVKFQVQCHVGGELVYDLDTAFGFFPEDAMVNQKGLPIATDGKQLALPNNTEINMKEDITGIADGKLLMIDRVTRLDPHGGAEGRGYIRAEKDVAPSDWFFKSHFFQDPVQPGSLGVEAMIQLMQVYMAQTFAKGEEVFFEPVSSGEEIEWHYRGQVAPHIKQMTVDFELTEVNESAAQTVMTGIGRLWVEGKKIYEAPRLAMTMKPQGKALAVNHTPLNGQDGRIKFDLIYDQLKGQDDARLQTVYDVFTALAYQFVGQVHLEDPAALAALHGKPVLYLANHQVGIESLLFMTMVKTLQGNPVRAIAKSEHQKSIYGGLQDLRAEVFGGLSPIGMYFFQRDHHLSIFSCLEEYKKDQQDYSMSLLCHVDGTRSVVANDPVKAVSSIFIDLAKSTGLPIVPVRFAGALPETNDEQKRFEFPVHWGAQDYYIGKPIPAAELSQLGLKDAVERVKSGINRLGPKQEQAKSADPKFKTMMHGFQSQGATVQQSLLLACLACFAEAQPQVHELRQKIIDGSLDPMTRRLFELFQ
ncbi:beta-ketoacyl synthase N-terminal-like domain-containing protein [Pseudobacteriovorax antillogorgiicola]|uniref:FabA-like domain-containing protein n=1 Tax=Pseudobacteriovorax antillogorgiicola TaxID=1513793 RepID=A0A1Y6CM78_9BACT|nr:beta-ketoacyl synthase N-terminal-like domain-containing protein [Pseudobacteriovorax antillogorgiicola]TCS46914.1 FabA-like protein [Pseudobacteriovorax antillogorgiicola]SMF64143.1 FabA-like domain-containing protein [Pseudobacteriovorax antillogorgiicola]